MPVSNDLETPQYEQRVAQLIGYRGGLPCDGAQIIAHYIVELQRQVAALETRCMLLEQSTRNTSAVPPQVRNIERATVRTGELR